MVRAGKAQIRRHWPLIRRSVTLAFFTLVAYLLIRHAGTIEWREVGDALTAYHPMILLAAGGQGLCAILVYSCFDLIGQAYIASSAADGGEIGELPRRQVMLVTFISYVFNLNLGALVGGFAFRYRLYSRLGIGNTEITTILGLSVATNWLGYSLLGGLVFSSGVIELPDSWKIGSGTLQVIGSLLLMLPITYLVLCGYRGGRSLTIHGREIQVPTLNMALLQFTLSCLHWLLMSSIIFVLLGQQVDYFVVLGVLLLSGIAGALTHIPGALGVLETVFIMLLSERIPRSELLAALLAYRAVFYLFPLLLAASIYLVLEIRFKRQHH